MPWGHLSISAIYQLLLTLFWPNFLVFFAGLFLCSISFFLPNFFWPIYFFWPNIFDKKFQIFFDQVPSTPTSTTSSSLTWAWHSWTPACYYQFGPDFFGHCLVSHGHHKVRSLCIFRQHYVYLSLFATSNWSPHQTLSEVARVQGVHYKLIIVIYSLFFI